MAVEVTVQSYAQSDEGVGPRSKGIVEKKIHVNSGRRFSVEPDTKALHVLDSAGACVAVFAEHDWCRARAIVGCRCSDQS